MADELVQGHLASRYCPVCAVRYDEGESCPVDGATLVIEREADPLIGTVLGDAYRIDGCIGAGGMGRVYRGVQLSLDRPIAIKVMRAERSADPSMVRRFLQEARLSSSLDHPNIVRVIDGGNTSEGRCYLVMELLEGVTLDEHVPEGGLPYAEARGLFVQLCVGVQAFHRAGLVHRDLKPKNVILCARDDGELQVKIFDFGLAKRLDPEVTGLTVEGQFLGTPGYLAPEQMSCGEITEQTDVYALGAMFYYMLSKRPAFSGKSGPAIVMRQLANETESLDSSLSGAPPQLEAIIQRALSLEPERRFESVSSFARAVAELDRTPAYKQDAGRARGGLSRRAMLLGGGGLMGLAGAIGGIALIGRAPIELGMSGALTGLAGAIGRDMELGLQARFAMANEGGELRRQLVLEVLDDGYEPERARANVEHFTATKLALVGNVGTRTTAACVPALLAAKLPMLGAHSGAEHLRRDPPDRYVFNFRAGYARETAALVEHYLVRERLAPTSIAVLAQDDGYGVSGIDGIRRALADHDFVDFDRVLVTRYPSNTMDVRAAVETVSAAAGIELVVLVAAYRAAAQFVAQLAPRRPKLSFAGISPTGSAAFVDELRHLGHDPTGIVLTQVVPHPDSAANGVLRYREALAQFRPDAVPSFVSLEGFIVGDLLVEALRRCRGSYEREALVEALEGFSGLDLGFGTPIAFSPSDHQGSDRVWASRIEADGRLVDFALS